MILQLMKKKIDDLANKKKKNSNFTYKDSNEFNNIVIMKPHSDPPNIHLPFWEQIKHSSHVFYISTSSKPTSAAYATSIISVKGIIPT